MGRREILRLDLVRLGEIEVYVFSLLNLISVWCLLKSRRLSCESQGSRTTKFRPYTIGIYWVVDFIVITCFNQLLV